MGHLVQHHRLTTCPQLGWQLDDDLLRQVAGTHAAARTPNRHRIHRGVGTTNLRMGQDGIDIGLDGGDIAEPPLHGHIDPRAEEVDDTTSVKHRGPLILSGVDGVRGHTRRIG